MRLMILCGLLIQVVLFSHDHKPSFRALIVYDSSTHDVRAAAAADAARVKEALGFVAGRAGLVFRPKILTANTFSPKTFQKWLKTIHPSSGDTAFFYYAGRGSNRPHQEWPYISFGKKKQICEKKILWHINSHKPNVAVVVCDCYGKAVTDQSRVNFQRTPPLDLAHYGPMPGFNNLFRKPKGWAMWSSGKNVQKAYFSSQQQPIGGLFTSNFLRGLFGYSEQRYVGWTNVASCTRIRLHLYAAISPTPVFECKFTKKPKKGFH